MKINKIFKRVFLKLVREYISLVTKIDKRKVLLVVESFSGSNTLALYKLIPSQIHSAYNVVLLNDYNPRNLTSFIKKFSLITSAKYIITTHESYKPSKKHIHIQLWHGAVVKKNGVLVSNKKTKSHVKSVWPKVDYIMSYSETYNTFMNACMFADPSKYIITGAPRNDFLFKSDGLLNLQKIFGDNVKEKKIAFFLPTFRDYCNKEDGKRNVNNIFGFKDFSHDVFFEYLEKNNLLFIFKPHPHEEDLVLKYFSPFESSNFHILKNEDLVSNQIDLYELLNASSILLTDYSSVFFDFLLLEKPIVFVPVDVESFKESRGFLVESFETWVPGPSVFSQDELQKEITKSFVEKGYYSEQRTSMRNNLHRFKDGESSYRIWEFISNLEEN